MVVVRLAKSGAKKNPYYFITVADSRKPRDGAFIERLGFFNPSAKGSEERMRFNVERLDHWIAQGAQLSDKVKELAKDSSEKWFHPPRETHLLSSHKLLFCISILYMSSRACLLQFGVCILDGVICVLQLLASLKNYRNTAFIFHYSIFHYILTPFRSKYFSSLVQN